MRSFLTDGLELTKQLRGKKIESLFGLLRLLGFCSCWFGTDTP